MTTLLESPAVDASAEGPAKRGGLTLEKRLGRVLEGVRTDGRAECPVCGGAVTAEGLEHARCRDCGSQIA